MQFKRYFTVNKHMQVGNVSAKNGILIYFCCNFSNARAPVRARKTQNCMKMKLPIVVVSTIPKSSS